MYVDILNGEQQRKELDLLLKIREEAKLRNEKHKTLIAQAVNQKVKEKSFLERSLIF